MNLVAESNMQTVDVRRRESGYYITEYQLISECENGLCYSVRVVMYKNGCEICRSMAYNLTNNHELVKALFDALWYEWVTPIDLHDAICDLLY